MAEIGEPFAFCGRIVEAYYSNPELDYVVVDEEDDQFKALLKEFAYDSIDECTRKKHEIHRQQFRDAFNNYARENDMLKVESIQEERRASLDILFDFDPENDKDKEELFKLKLKIFDQDVVQNSKATKKKTKIRKAETPLEAIVVYKSFFVPFLSPAGRPEPE